jgi:spermidine synthase
VAGFGFSLGGEPKLLFEQETEFNHVRVIDEPNGVRTLRLDDGAGAHSVYAAWDVFTGGVWDDMALVPAVVPAGPVGILGLGAGCAARLLRHFWPERPVVGWELDPVVVDVAREFFALAPEVEVRVGDAFADDEGGYAALLVDIYADGTFPHERYLDPATWERQQARLVPGGRLFVNLATRPGDEADARVPPVIAAACGGAATKRRANGSLVALSGACPEPEAWRRALPEQLRDLVEGWGPA